MDIIPELPTPPVMPLSSVRRRVQFLALTMTVAVIASVPVLSTYGLAVCPVLLPLGFRFGCGYLVVFALNLLVLNTLFLHRLTRALATGATVDPALVKAAPRRSAIAYLLAYALTVLELLAYLAWQDLPLSSRGPEVLAIMALLLAILQYYATAWAILPAAENIATAATIRPHSRWTRGALRVAVPAMITAAVGAHFVVRSAELESMLGLAAADHGGSFDMVQLLAFLLVWQLAVMAFYTAAEVDFSRRAAQHLNAVGREDYAWRSAELSWGYWPELFGMMNRLSQGLLERSRLLRGFSAFVSQRVAEEVLQEDLKFDGKRAEVTVLMADLRGFTTLAEKLRPEEVVKLLNLFFYAMIEELGRTGVTVDKFIGDGLLAYVEPGEVAQPADECTRAVQAAQDMIRRLETVNGELAALGLPRLKLGIGIARGPLVVGKIGSLERMQHTVIGDTVNLASRIESLSKELAADLVIEHHVRDSLPPGMQAGFVDRGEHPVRGRSERVRLFAWTDSPARAS